jgi:Flp pilus assembly protein TadD
MASRGVEPARIASVNRWNQIHTMSKTPDPAKRLQSKRCNQTPPFGVRHTKKMAPTTNGDRPTQDTAAPAEGWESGTVASEVAAKKHFDTFETSFFQQGDDSASFPVEFDDLDQGAKGKRPLLSRPSLMGLAIASTSLAFLACLALWQSNSPAPSPVLALTFSNARPVGRTGAATSPPTAAATPTQATPAEPAPQPGSAAPGSVADPAPLPTAAEQAEPAPTRPSAQQAEQAANSGEKPQAVPAAPLPNEAPAPAVVAKAEAEPMGAAPAPAPESDARDRCKQSIREKRSKDILALCPAAFAEDTTDADAAVALAKVEFDRGRFAQAYAWSKKAIAVNPASADAYVFAGGAEQNRGHGKAAKEAYLHYLRLAPSGRYAAELRTIVNSL